jgi:homoserine O-acetyltransferase/O-succinyltransferase
MVVDNPYYSAEVHGPYATRDVGDLVLEEGATLRGCTLAYSTHGTLNAAKDNAILVTTWYTGTHGVMVDAYIGPGRALDPTKYFIVVVDQIGSGLSTSPHNTAGPYGRGRFPHVRIGDDVVAQERLLREEFGIERLELVFGGSMGAQQTYEWAVRFPDKVRRAAPLAGTAHPYPHCQVFVEALREALAADPNYRDGFYERSTDVRAGLNLHQRPFAMYVFSDEFWEREVWREMGFSSRADFHTEFLEGYTAPMDAGDLRCQAWKWMHGDVSRHTGGDLPAALARITAKTFVLPISHDRFFTVADCAAEQKLIPGSELRVIDDVHGHASLFNLVPTYQEQVDRHLGELLALPV